MAEKRQQSGNPKAGPPAGVRAALTQHARIWLGTLSTLVAVATGMFALRDEILPGDAGTAAAVSVPAYQQQVARVCDQVNDDERDRAREDAAIRTKLPRATTTIAQRNLLLDPVRSTIARSERTFASFTALDTPKALGAGQRDTEAPWSRNLARLRDYAERLDRASTRARLQTTIHHLSSMRSLLAIDGTKLTSGLERLGAANCDLRPPKVTAAFTLPDPRRGPRRRPAPSSRLNTPSYSASAGVG